MEWTGSPNFWAGRRGHQPIALVLHTMDGSLAGCDSHFATPASQVSAHYGVGLNGAIHQYVQLSDSAWGNGVPEAGNTWPGAPGVSPNLLSVSIETEDHRNNDEPVTAAQYQAVLALGGLARRTYPSITMLVAHRVISPVSRANCPGRRWINTGRFQQLANDLGLHAIS